MDERKMMGIRLPESAVRTLENQFWFEFELVYDVFKRPSHAAVKHTPEEFIPDLDTLDSEMDRLKDISEVLVKIYQWNGEKDPWDIYRMTIDIYDALTMHAIGVQTGAERRQPTKEEAMACFETLERIKSEKAAFKEFYDKVIIPDLGPVIPQDLLTQEVRRKAVLDDPDMGSSVFGR